MEIRERKANRLSSVHGLPDYSILQVQEKFPNLCQQTEVLYIDGDTLTTC